MHLSTKLYRARLVIVASLLYVLLLCLYIIVAVFMSPVYDKDGEYLKYNICTKTYTETVRIKTVEYGYKLNGKAFRRFYFYTSNNGVCYIDTENTGIEVKEGMLINSMVTDIILTYNDGEVIDRTLFYNTYFNDSDVIDIQEVKNTMLETVQSRILEVQREYELSVLTKILLGGFFVTLLYLFIQGVRIRRLIKQYEEMRVLSILEE